MTRAKLMTWALAINSRQYSTKYHTPLDADKKPNFLARVSHFYYFDGPPEDRKTFMKL